MDDVPVVLVDSVPVELCDVAPELVNDIDHPLDVPVEVPELVVVVAVTEPTVFLWWLQAPIRSWCRRVTRRRL